MSKMNYSDVKIKELGNVVTGKTPLTAKQEYYNGEYMFISPNELHEGYLISKSEKTLTEKGLKSIATNSISGTSVLVGCIGWDMGNVAICLERCATNQQINSITNFKSAYNPYYIYYWLLTKKEYLFSIASVTRTPILSKGTFEDILIPVPGKPIQDKIAGVLLTIDKKIELNNKINETLQQQASLLYDYWFTQFDFPDANGKPYKSSGGKMVWNEQLKREIPEGWKVETMAENCLYSIMKPGVNNFNSKIYLATADVNGTSVSIGNIVEFATRESRANMQPKVNSVWFAKMKNSVKHLFLNKEMKSLIDTSILSTGFCGLQCTEKSFEYVSSFISNIYFETIKDTLAHGATQEAVNNDDLGNINIVIPKDKALNAFHDSTKSIYSMISKNSTENQQLASLRDWLLPMLMNGQAVVE